MKKLNSKLIFNDVMVVRSCDCEKLLCFSHIESNNLRKTTC